MHKKNQACSRRTLSRAMSLGKALCSGPTKHSLGRAAQSLFLLQSFVTKNIYYTNLLCNIKTKHITIFCNTYYSRTLFIWGRMLNDVSADGLVQFMGATVYGVKVMWLWLVTHACVVLLLVTCACVAAALPAIVSDGIKAGTLKTCPQSTWYICCWMMSSNSLLQ